MHRLAAADARAWNRDWRLKGPAAWAISVHPGWRGKRAGRGFFGFFFDRRQHVGKHSLGYYTIALLGEMGFVDKIGLGGIAKYRTQVVDLLLFGDRRDSLMNPIQEFFVSR